MKPQHVSVATDAGEDLHERAEAALGWIDEAVSAACTASPDWAAQSCEEIAPASATGRLLGAVG